MFASSHLASALRVLVLCLVVGGVLAKPLLVIASDAHTASHVLATGEDGHGDHDTPSEPIDPNDAKDPWHALMHLGECCAQSPALLPDVDPCAFAPLGGLLLRSQPIAFEPTAQAALYRPPIRS